MKLKYISLLLFLQVIALFGCQQQTVTEISLYKMTSYTSSETGSLRTITNEEEIKVFMEAVKKAEKQPGIVDMASPEYRFDLTDGSYFLWIDEDKGRGSLMHAEDTHFLYTLPDDIAVKLIEIVQEKYKE